ncbi:MAG: hypothetical protein V1834_03160, partial [Candidatus Micrarchaeota archaeon]
EYELKVIVSAKWFDVSEAGPIGFGQGREFTFTVRTITTEFSEEKVATPEASATPSEKIIYLQSEQDQTWFYAAIGLGVLVVLLLIYNILSSRKKKIANVVNVQNIMGGRKKR